MRTNFLTMARSHCSTPREASQSDRSAPTRPCRRKLSGHRKARYIPDTASFEISFSHKKAQKAHKNFFEFSALTTFINLCLLCLLRLLKQTENVGEVVGPNHVSLHPAPAIVCGDR